MAQVRIGSGYQQLRRCLNADYKTSACCIVVRECRGTNTRGTRRMKLMGQNIGATSNAGLFGMVLLVTAVSATALAFIDIRLAFAAFGMLAVGLIIKFFGLGQFVPTRPVGWLYAAIIFVTCWAPSLGNVGTAARFALAAITFITLVHSFSLPAPRLDRALKIGIALLVLSLAVSTIGAASAGYGLARVINWSMFLPLIWLAVRKPDIKGAAFGLVATCVFQMVGIALQVTGLMGGTWGGLLTSGTTYNPETSSWLKRYTGFIWNPNNLALILACGIIVLAACMLGKVGARVRIGSLTLIAVFTVGVISTGSRGGLVAIALGVGVLLMAAGRRGLALGVVAVGLGTTAYVVSGSQELDRLIASFAEIVSGTDASATQRRGVWLDWFQSAEGGKWVLGNGFGGYAADIFANQRGLDIDPALARMATVDNSWLRILLESGIVGVLGMALTMLSPMFSSLTRSTGERRVWGIAAGAILVALLWRSVSVDMFDQNPWNAVVFLIVGLAAASTDYRSTDTAEPAAKDSKRSVAAP
jgi:O-antigen ligase